MSVYVVPPSPVEEILRKILEKAAGIPMLRWSYSRDIGDEWVSVRVVYQRGDRYYGIRVDSPIEGLSSAMQETGERIRRKLLEPDPVADKAGSRTAGDVEPGDSDAVIDPASPQDGVGDLGGEGLPEVGGTLDRASNDRLEAPAVQPFEPWTGIGGEGDSGAVGAGTKFDFQLTAVRHLLEFETVEEVRVELPTQD